MSNFQRPLVVVTGAFFRRAETMDSKVETDDNKANPAEAVKIGFDALMPGEGDVVAHWKAKWRAVIADVRLSAIRTEQHCEMVDPGSAA